MLDFGFGGFGLRYNADCNRSWQWLIMNEDQNNTNQSWRRWQFQKEGVGSFSKWNQQNEGKRGMFTERDKTIISRLSLTRFMDSLSTNNFMVVIHKKNEVHSISLRKQWKFMTVSKICTKLNDRYFYTKDVSYLWCAIIACS